MKTMKVRLSLLEPMLGTSPDADTFKEYVADPIVSTKKKEEESEYLPVQIDPKGKTVFPKLEDDTPFMWDYQIKGFFKDACGMLRYATGKGEDGKKLKAANESSKLTSYKKNYRRNHIRVSKKDPYFIQGENNDMYQTS